MKRPKRSYELLDNNGWAYLYGNPWHSQTDLRKLRNILRIDAEEGRRTILLTPILLVEVARIRDRNVDLFSDIANFAWRLAGFRIARDYSERALLEIKKEGRLSRVEFVYPKRESYGYIQSLNDEAFVKRIDEEHYQDMQRFLKSERDSYQDIVKRLGKLRCKQTRQWFKHRDDIIADWCFDRMEANRRKWMVRGKRRNWPDPRKFPTLWNLVAFHIGRIQLMHGKAEGVDKSDGNDSKYYSDSAYADIFVSSDKRVGKIAKLLGTESKVATFKDWADRILAT